MIRYYLIMFPVYLLEGETNFGYMKYIPLYILLEG